MRQAGAPAYYAGFRQDGSRYRPQKGQFMYNEIDLTQIDSSVPAPAREPERQYYFMAKLKELVDQKKEELGRPLTACIRTFGCPKNDV